MNDAEPRGPIEEDALAPGGALEHGRGVRRQVRFNDEWMKRDRGRSDPKHPGGDCVIKGAIDGELDRHVPVRRTARAGVPTFVIRVNAQGIYGGAHLPQHTGPVHPLQFSTV